MRIAWSWTVAAVLVPLLVWAAPNPSQGAAATAEPEPVLFNWQPGPKKVELGHELTLDLPGEHIFLEKAEAAKLLEMNGSFYNDNVLGVVASQEESSSWVVIIRYEEEGYIKDDEEIDADELLTAIKEGTEEANKERVERGFTAIHVNNWSEAPHYDKSRHHLIWALDAVGDTGTSVNYSTRVLGRRGYVSMNLVVDPAGFADSKPHMARLLESTRFNPGARYEDFQEGTDKVAEFGLAGLVLGGAGMGAAKLAKVGILAKFGKVLLALFLAGKKLLIPLLLVVGGLFSKLFGGKKTEDAPPPSNPGE